MVLKGDTCDHVSTVGGSFLGIFDLSTMYTKIPMKVVCGGKNDALY